jgi:hypothetical protein
MAFNPFEAFSIRSKLGRAVMAILGIVVMLTFVLSTGAVGSKNDFFDQIGAMFSGRSKGEVVAVAYGDDIHEADLREIGRQRQAANAYLVSVIDASYLTWAKDLKAGLEGSKATNETKQAVLQFLTLKANSETDPVPYMTFLTNQQQRQRIIIARVLARPEQTDDRKLLDAVLAIMSHDMLAGAKLPPPVFPDIGLESDRDRLDFAIALKKADKLGIRYSEDAIGDLVNRETNNRLRKEDSGRIEARIRESGKFGTFSSDWLVEAIGNEFRARDAYAAFQGQSPVAAGLRQARLAVIEEMFQMLRTPAPDMPMPGDTGPASAIPGAVTPYEFWDFYRDRCSEHTFSLLEISAESFLDQVKEEPTPKQRVELFNKYRGELPDPARPTPGFKEPRKLKVEFTTLDAKAERVTKAISQLKAASTFLCASSAAFSHNPVSALEWVARPGLAETLPIREDVSIKVQANLRPYNDIEKWVFVPRDWAIYHPRPIIAALGMLAGNPDAATFMGAAAAMHQQVEVIDHRSRVPFLLQPVLTPFTPTLGNAIGMPAFAYSLNPKPPPEGVYVTEITAEHKKEQRQKLFKADMDQLKSKLDELLKDVKPFGPRPEKSKVDQAYDAARKHMEQWLKDRGLTATSTPQPIDKWQVVTAPELKPLNDKATAEPDGSNSLANRLFDSNDFRRFGMGLVNTTTPFKPFWFPSDPVGDAFDKPNHYVWVSDDVDPKPYNTFDNANKLTNGEMTKRVDRAWKLEKARALAKAEADRLAEEVRAIGRTALSNPDGVNRQLKDLAAQKKLRKFEIERLAKLKFQHEATQARVNYEPPSIDPSLVVYKTPDFADQLLELRKEPLGAVTVLADAPRTRYYVACEIARFEKTVEQFRDSVFTKTNATGPAQNPLYQQYALQEEQIKAIEEVKLRLRADAHLEEKEAFKSSRRDSE